MPDISKSDLRQALRRSRESLPPELIEGWSVAIVGRLASLELWRQSAVLHSFVGALPGEVQTNGLIERALRQRMRVICPRVRAHGQLDHREVTELSQLAESVFGLREPHPDLSPPADPSVAELIVVPGVAFSLDGSRLGMGGGYYDRFLDGHPARRVGLAYEMQLTDSIPRSERDQPVDLIVTELRVIQCR